MNKRCPQGDLYEVCDEGEWYHQHNDCKIDRDGCARATGCSLISNEIDRRAHSERMDKNRTYDGAHANHQWNQDRDFMNLRHRSTKHPTLSRVTPARWCKTSGAALANGPRSSVRSD